MKQFMKESNKTYKLLVSGGGTGGHIFPAVAIANAFRRRHPETEVLFVGAKEKNGNAESAGSPDIPLKDSGSPDSAEAFPGPICCFRSNSYTISGQEPLCAGSARIWLMGTGRLQAALH